MLDHICMDSMRLLSSLTPMGQRSQRRDAPADAALRISIQRELECLVYKRGGADALSKIFVHQQLSVIEDFRNMQDPLRFILPVDSACNVHQAAAFCHYQGGGLDMLQVGDFSFQPFCRNLGVLHRKDSPKTAAFFGMR